ncbi:MAG TPA: cyclic nucleotide-binding domain-containing protein [Candidatus Cybelea sp.]|nr:cyclic nucleotide-binding domain-containing protein [Candidatus Cybelea sp.]
MRKALYILGQLNDADIQWFARRGRARRLKDGEIIIREGQPVDALFINLDGALGVTLGTGVEVARLGAGEFVGEISFVDSAPPSATVRSIGTTSVLEIKRIEIQRKIAEDLGFSARFHRALAVFLADRLRAATRRLGYGKQGDLATDTVLEDELDGTVLDTVSEAGERFRRLLTMLAA